MNRSHLRATALCAVALLVFAPAAFGADPRDSAIPSLGGLAGMLDALFSSADSMVGKLVPVGQKLLALAVVLELLYSAYMYFIKGSGSDFLASGFRTLIVTSVPLALLASWPEFPKALMSMFTSSVTEIVTGHAGGATGQVGSMLDSISKMSGQLLIPVPDGFWAHVQHPIDTTVDSITNLLVGIVMIFATVMFGCALLFATFGPLVMLKIGMIIGPILLPLLVWKPTSDIGMKWFTYMLSMCVAYVLGLILAQLALEAMGAQVALVQQQSGTYDTVMVTLLGLLPTVLAMVFCGFLLLKVEHIAAALIGGASIGSGAIVFAGALGSLKGGGGKGGGGNKGGGKDAGSKDGGGGDSNAGKPLLNPVNGKVTSGGDTKGQADLSKQASIASAAADKGGKTNPNLSGGGEKPDASAPGDSTGGSDKPGASAPGDSPKTAEGESGEKSPVQDGGNPSRAVRFAQGAWGATKFGVSHGWAGAKSVGGTSFGKAAAFAGATMVAGPIGGAAVGAFAVSPKMRGMVEKTGDFAGKWAGIGGDKLMDKIAKPKAAKGKEDQGASGPKDSLGE